MVVRIGQVWLSKKEKLLMNAKGLTEAKNLRGGSYTPLSGSRTRSTSPYLVANGSRQGGAMSSETERAVIDALYTFKSTILIPRGLGTPCFKGTNITEFVKKYSKLYKDFGLVEKDIVK